MDLVGKVAFVTGGSGDIGRAIAIALAGAGVDVAVSYVSSEERASSTVDAIQGMGRRGLAMHLNQRDPFAIKTACDKVMGAFNRIDILVNNAAWNIGIPFEDLDALTAEIWDQMLEINLRGPVLAGEGVRTGASSSQDGSDHQYRLGLRDHAEWQQHCVCVKQGSPDPPHPLFGGRSRA